MGAISYEEKHNGLVWAFVSQEVHPKTLILWLVTRVKLNTKDKLVRYEVIFNATCNLCNTCDENIDHIFFQRDFSTFVWRNVIGPNNVSYSPQGWGDYSRQIAGEWKGDDLGRVISKMCLGQVCMLFGKKEMTEASQVT